jgi:hypothetical protein
MLQMPLGLKGRKGGLLVRSDRSSLLGWYQSF